MSLENEYEGEEFTENLSRSEVEQSSMKTHGVEQSYLKFVDYVYLIAETIMILKRGEGKSSETSVWEDKHFGADVSRRGKSTFHVKAGSSGIALFSQ